MIRYFSVKNRSSAFLITAPHCSRALLDRTKAPEPGDRGTGYLASLLAEKLGGSSVIAKYSRLVVDFNLPRGKSTRQHFHIYKLKKTTDKEERLKAYDQYYEALKSLITKNTFHISLHSMYYKGPRGSAEEGKRRPDFRLGTRRHTTIDKEKVEKIKKGLEEKGFSVEVDHLFKGGEEIKKIAEFGAKSLQIEINSNLLLKDDNLPYQEKTYDKSKVESLAEVLYECLR